MAVNMFHEEVSAHRCSKKACHDKICKIHRFTGQYLLQKAVNGLYCIRYFSVEFVKLFRKHFLKNTYGGLILYKVSYKFQSAIVKTRA